MTPKKSPRKRKAADQEIHQTPSTESVAQPSPAAQDTSRGVSVDSELLGGLFKKFEEIEGKFQKKVEEVSDEFERKLDERESKFDSKIDGRELRIMEVLSIFVVVITFVSTNITIFARVDSLATAVWFMIVMAFCLVFLISFLFLVIHNYKIGNTPVSKWGIFATTAAAVLLLIGLALFPRFDQPLNPSSESVQNNFNQLTQQYQFQQTEIKTLQEKF